MIGNNKKAIGYFVSHWRSGLKLLGDFLWGESTGSNWGSSSGSNWGT